MTPSQCSSVSLFLTHTHTQKKTNYYILHYFVIILCPNARPVHGRPASMGVVKADGDSYFLSVDVSQFEPHDIVVMAYNHRVTVHAEKVGEGGSIMDTLSHKTLLPADMDPLSTSCSLTPEGVLVISKRSSLFHTVLEHVVVVSMNIRVTEQMQPKARY
uniref:SHSP domain-containing protein n=1 Tax=Denticeps clupeoides TaxID=299321 RepID=A0AAY4E224_9TELE